MAFWNLCHENLLINYKGCFFNKRNKRPDRASPLTCTPLKTLSNDVLADSAEWFG